MNATFVKKQRVPTVYRAGSQTTERNEALKERRSGVRQERLCLENLKQGHMVAFQVNGHFSKSLAKATKESLSLGTVDFILSQDFCPTSAQIMLPASRPQNGLPCDEVFVETYCASAQLRRVRAKHLNHGL